MRFAGFWMCMIAVAVNGCAARLATTASQTGTVAQAGKTPQLSGVWDAMNQAIVDDGAGSGDTRIEKQEWHLTQAGAVITGYYVTAVTFVSGDGRPYACSRRPQFSATQRYDVSGRVRDGLIEIQELGLENGPSSSRCDPGMRQLARYRGQLEGDVLILFGGGERHTLYRVHNTVAPAGILSDAPARTPNLGAADERSARRSPELSPPPPAAGTPATPASGIPADISGLWVWEHHGTIAGGDEKQEREEWHVTQDGARVTGYYDRVVRQVSVDGHAYRCSMALDFQIATRYQFSGEVRGNELRIFERSFEVLSPNPCDNGRRRLDAYEGQAGTDEIRLVWGVGGQVLRRPRPDVPTQRF
jgi:hypothetical protein